MQALVTKVQHSAKLLVRVRPTCCKPNGRLWTCESGTSDTPGSPASTAQAMRCSARNAHARCSACCSDSSFTLTACLQRMRASLLLTSDECIHLFTSHQHSVEPVQACFCAAQWSMICRSSKAGVVAGHICTCMAVLNAIDSALSRCVTPLQQPRRQYTAVRSARMHAAGPESVAMSDGRPNVCAALWHRLAPPVARK